MRRPRLFGSMLGVTLDGLPYSRSRWIVWLSVVLAVLFLYLSLKDMDWASFWSVLSNAQYGLLPGVLAWTTLSYFIRALRWRVLLLAEGHISRLDSFWANMSGYLGNNILPARAGELVRATCASRMTDLSLSFVLAGGLSERLMDVIVLILLGSVSLAVSGVASGALQQAIQSMAIAAVIGIAIFLFLPAFSPLLRKIIAQSPFLNLNVKEKILSFFDKFLLGLRALFHTRRAVAFSFYTALIWTMDGWSVVLIGFILHIPITLMQAFVLLAALGLSSAIPSTPGYIGVYQFAAIIALTPFGISQADALAFILISQIMGYIVVVFWGVIGLWKVNENIYS